MTERRTNKPIDKDQKPEPSTSNDQSASESESFHTAMSSLHEIPRKPERKVTSFQDQEDSVPAYSSVPRLPSAHSRRIGVYGDRSLSSFNSSIFGDDPVVYSDTERRKTFDWPASGCIHIPLIPPKDEDTEENQPANKKIGDKDTDTKEANGKNQ